MLSIRYVVANKASGRFLSPSGHPASNPLTAGVWQRPHDAEWQAKRARARTGNKWEVVSCEVHLPDLTKESNGVIEAKAEA
jgi:hypothetical protein